MSSRKSELFVAATLKKYGWKILFHDVRVMHVQVDILARSPDGVLTIVEVKSQSRFRVAHISPGQMRRLGRVGQFLAGFEPVQMRVAFREGHQVSLLPVDALTDF